MIKQNDYRLRNGTVLEYNESGYDRTDSEYECAKSWLIKGEPGMFQNKSRNGKRAKIRWTRISLCYRTINS